MSKYEVIESKVWQARDGRTASIYGAVPYYSEAQRAAEGWEIVSYGWTVYNPYTGQVGICRPPFATRDDAQAWADTHAPSRIGYGD